MSDFWENVRNAAEYFSEGVNNNIGPALSLVGVGFAFLGAAELHRERLRRERNARIRALLGEYVGAVNHRRDAKRSVAARARDLSAGTPMLHAIRTVTGKGSDPTVAVLRANLLQAREELAHAESTVDSLFFQLSINREKGSEDVIFALKLLEAAETDTDYTVAYNFMLSVAVRWFGDSWRDRRKERKVLKRKRREAKLRWDRVVEQRESPQAREEDRVASMLEGQSEVTSGAGDEPRSSSGPDESEQTEPQRADSESSSPSGDGEKGSSA